MKLSPDFSILELRKTAKYRFLESLLGYSAVGFFLFVIALSVFSPAIASVFILVYSFMWLLRVALVVIYTIYSYKATKRWERIDWKTLLLELKNDPKKGLERLLDFQNLFKKTLDFADKVEEDIKVLQDEIDKQSPYSSPSNIWQFPIFSLYNESADVLTRSLESIYKSGYPLERLVVFVTQEARMGEEWTQKIRDEIAKLTWVETHNVSEADLEIVYAKNHATSQYENPKMADISISSKKLTVLFTQHPDGLVGEVKGKASNEDWAARQISLFCKAQKIDTNTGLVTSLDADSKVGVDFFQKLSFRFCVTKDRLRSGFQPVPVYSNNYFDSHAIQRLVATQTTLWQFTQNSLDGETHFFANYSVPLKVLQEIDFWVREVIAEDFMIYAKCVAYYKGDFKVRPFYGVFCGDAVEADDYFEALENQYKQLQRWSWGGVESFPYLFAKLFWTEDSDKMDLRTRIKTVYLLFSNHFFWSTAPVLFSVGIFIPAFFGGKDFQQTQISQNLSIFASYYAWISILFIIMFGFITISYIAKLASNKLTPKQLFLIFLQSLISPFVYGIMAIPALDSQWRGVTKDYLGYWVTPKK